MNVKKMKKACLCICIAIIFVLLIVAGSFIRDAYQEEQARQKATALEAARIQQEVMEMQLAVEKQGRFNNVNGEVENVVTTVYNMFEEKHEEVLARSVILDVNNIYQSPQLPNGCEITSATIVLNYWGFDVDKVTMADVYLPKQYPYYQADPEVAYMGNPHTGQGWYCLPEPVVTAVNAYFDAIGETDMKAENITGATVDELKTYIQSGRPIVFWATVGFQNIQYSNSFTLPNGQKPYTGLHCLVLTGYDESTMYIADPMGRTSQVSIERFTEIYDGMEQRAVLIS